MGQRSHSTAYGNRSGEVRARLTIPRPERNSAGAPGLHQRLAGPAGTGGGGLTWGGRGSWTFPPEREA